MKLQTGYRRASYAVSSYSNSISLGTKYLEPGSSSAGVYSVYGTVLDEDDDSYISDARVVLIDDYDDITYTGYTNSRGNFDISGVPLGNYEISITKYGYRDYEESNFQLRVGNNNLVLSG